MPVPVMIANDSQIAERISTESSNEGSNPRLYGHTEQALQLFQLNGTVIHFSE
jgi:hypothetical protein